MTTNEEKNTQLYLQTLSGDEKTVIKIAKKTLESSFDLSKSIGYLKWLAKNNL
tara:strand:+ start:135 stop:293 length:159 start_codon:yes stop_codon:yes gene_type:complete